MYLVTIHHWLIWGVGYFQSKIHLLRIVWFFYRHCMQEMYALNHQTMIACLLTAFMLLSSAAANTPALAIDRRLGMVDELVTIKGHYFSRIAPHTLARLFTWSQLKP